MILITTYYLSDNLERQKEIDRCLFININNKHIKKIYLLTNQKYDKSIVNNKKIIQVIVSEDENYKLKYNDAIRFINDNLKDKICILSNSDIYFDNSLSKITKDIIQNNFFGILRYDEDIDGNKKIFTFFDEPRSDSQDCWIFQSPLKVDYDKINFQFGTLGCDNIFASVVNDIGLHVSNPCYDIIITHVHLTNLRTYNVDNRIHGKYCLIKPCHLNEKIDVSFMDY